MAQTSDQVSRLAARYLSMSTAALQKKVGTADGLNDVAADLRTMAASLLRQDEVKGLRRLIQKVTGL